MPGFIDVFAMRGNISAVKCKQTGKVLAHRSGPKQFDRNGGGEMFSTQITMPARSIS